MVKYRVLKLFMKRARAQNGSNWGQSLVFIMKIEDLPPVYYIFLIVYRRQK